MRKSQSISKNDFYIYIVIILIVLVSISRLFTMGKDSLWHDELHTYLFSSYSFKDLFSTQLDPVHPPLVYIGLKIWKIITFSDSVILLRLPSFIFTVFSCVLIFNILKERLSVFLSMSGCLLFILLHTTFHYAAEVRHYSFCVFIFLLFYKYYILKNRVWISVCIFLLGVYTHYLLFLYMGSLMILKTYKSKKIQLADVVGILLTSPLLFQVYSVLESGKSSHWDFSQKGVSYFELLETYFYGVFFYDKSYLFPDLYLSYLLPGIYLAAIVFYLMKSDDKNKPYVLAITFIPFVFMGIFPLNEYKYVYYFPVSVFIPYVIFEAVHFVDNKLFIRTVILFILSIWVCRYIPGSTFYQEYRKTQWKEAFSLVASHDNYSKNSHVVLNPVIPSHDFGYQYYENKFLDGKNVILLSNSSQFRGIKDSESLYVISISKEKALSKLNNHFDINELELLKSFDRLNVYKIKK